MKRLLALLLCPLFIALTVVGAGAASPMETSEPPKSLRSMTESIGVDLKTLLSLWYETDLMMLTTEGSLEDRVNIVGEEYPFMLPAGRSIGRWIKCGLMGASPFNENMAKIPVVSIVPLADSPFFSPMKKGMSISPLYFQGAYLLTDVELDPILFYRSSSGKLYLLAILENSTGSTIRLTSVDMLRIFDSDRKVVVAEGRSTNISSPVVVANNDYPVYEGDRMTFDPYHGTKEGHPYLCFLLFAFEPGSFDPSVDFSELKHFDVAVELSYS